MRGDRPQVRLIPENRDTAPFQASDQVPLQPSTPSDRSRAPGPTLLALAAVAYVVLQIWVPAGHLTDTPGDFGNYYEAARALLEGRSPYSVHNFDYPPLVALVLLPVAGLSLEVARWGWFVVSQLALLAAAWATWKAAGGDRRALAVVAALWCLAGTVQENLVLGQVHPLMLALLAAALVDLGRRPNRAALLVGVAAGLKIWPGLLLALFIPRREWRPLAVGVVTAAVLLVSPSLVFKATLPPPATPASAPYWTGNPAPLNQSLSANVLRLTTWPRGTPAAETEPAERPRTDRGNRRREPMPRSWRQGNNPRVFLLPPRQAAVSVGVSLACLALGGGLLGALLFRTPARHRKAQPTAGRTRRVAAAALTTLAVLASPISWYHYQLFQLPGLALVGTDVAASRPGARRWAGLAVWALLATVLTRAHLAFGAYVRTFGWTVEQPALLVLITGTPAVAEIVLFGWLCALTARDILPGGRRDNP